MSRLGLTHELVGGPCDGRIWSSDWQPHWCRAVACGVPQADGRAIVWAEYELMDSRVVWDNDWPSVRFCYRFVGLRESGLSSWGRLKRKLGGFIRANAWRSARR